LVVVVVEVEVVPGGELVSGGELVVGSSIGAVLEVVLTVSGLHPANTTRREIAVIDTMSLGVRTTTEG
jgi:hypothetical protein